MRLYKHNILTLGQAITPTDNKMLGRPVIFSLWLRQYGNTCVLEQVDKEKDLGVITDNTLSFEDQCEKSITNANRILFTIRRTFMFIDEQTFLQLYKPLVRSTLEYGVEIWNPKLKRQINKIEAVQRRATRMIPAIMHLSYEDRLRRLGLPTLVYRRRRGAMIQTL